MLTLYFASRSSFMAAHIALHEVGAPFEARPLSSESARTGFLDTWSYHREG